uniref:Uncharacterized protein n=1 Tax=Sinocyclocheilus anshuiensis TaxID=1608454 RepID=A0A671KG99_9TELE
MYVLGKEAMESQEEDSVAAGHFDWCTGGHHSNRWHRSSCYGYRPSCLHWTQGRTSLKKPGNFPQVSRVAQPA